MAVGRQQQTLVVAVTALIAEGRTRTLYESEGYAADGNNNQYNQFDFHV